MRHSCTAESVLPCTPPPWFLRAQPGRQRMRRYCRDVDDQPRQPSDALRMQMEAQSRKS
jgi:hypothetical protein